MASSYNGWPVSPNPVDISVNRAWEPIPGHRFPGGVKSGDVEVIFTYLVVQLDARVEPIEHYPDGDEWGYAYRANRNNPNQLSCHASGTAIDYNATRHPNRVAYTWTREQSRTINTIVNDELDGVVKWLEGWDEMHFEIRGNASQVKAVANKIRNQEDDMPLTQADLDKIKAMMKDAVGDELAERGLVGPSTTIPGGAIAELRRNVRRIGAAVDADEIE